MRTFRHGLWALIIGLIPLLAQAQDVALVIKGQVKTPLTLSLAEIKAMPIITNTIIINSDKFVYEGASLHEILKQAGVPYGKTLRGDALQLCVIVKAADDYKVVFSLAELDPAFTGRQVMLAYKKNGEDLDAKAGPLRVICDEAQSQARWVREVKELEVVRVVGNGDP